MLRETEKHNKAAESQMQWGPIFRRNLMEAKEIQLFSGHPQPSSHSDSPKEHKDSKVWMPAQDGEYSVTSFFLPISRSFPCASPLYRTWKLKAPPRVIAFSWLVQRGGILTMDNLHRRKRILVNACPMCLEDQETDDHILLRCRVAHALWSLVLTWFECHWTFPRSAGQLFQAWHLQTQLEARLCGGLLSLWFSGCALKVKKPFGGTD